MLKTTTAEALRDSYSKLNPGEGQIADAQPFANWLARYERDPASAIATVNWAGKVTAALFQAVGIRKPRTKRAMLAALGG